MELKDTIEMMNSSDYKERFKAEYYQVAIRLDKLSKTISKYYAGTLEFKLSTPIDVLKTQFSLMDAYLKTLELRAVIEHIEL